MPDPRTEPSPRLASRLLAACGWAYLALGLSLALTPLARRLLLGPAEGGAGPTTTALLVTGGAVLGACGAAFVRWRRRPAMVNLHLAFLSALLISPLAGEVVLRAGIALGMDAFRRPDLYADYFGDDSYYQLRLRWQPARAGSVAGRFHPLLGWAPPATDGNPLGLMDDAPPRPGTGDPVVLFYGDSFIAGGSVPSPRRIPQVLDTLLPEHDVLNLGVGGYGLGQIALRFQETHRRFAQPVIVIGLLTTDLDRTVLGFRTGPKPWFELEGGELRLRGAPMVENSPAWRQRFEPRVRSYLGAALFRFWDRLTRPQGPAESRYRRAEKEAVNSALLDRIVAECRDAGQPVSFVIFSAYLSTGESGWRERFLARRLAELGVPWLETTLLLRSEAERRGVDVGTFMLDDGHLNPEGNALVAAAVASLLRSLPDPRPAAGQGPHRTGMRPGGG